MLYHVDLFRKEFLRFYVSPRHTFGIEMNVYLAFIGKSDCSSDCYSPVMYVGYRSFGCFLWITSGLHQPNYVAYSCN